MIVSGRKKHLYKNMWFYILHIFIWMLFNWWVNIFISVSNEASVVLAEYLVNVASIKYLLLFTHHCSAGCFRIFCAEIPGSSAQNRIFLRFLYINYYRREQALLGWIPCDLAKRVTGHSVNSSKYLADCCAASLIYCQLCCGIFYL